VEISISGRVQGVGYRYFCVRVARQLELTGWVKNNPNGTVSAWLEGNKEAVDDAIEQFRLGPSSAHVTNIAVGTRQSSGQFQSFEITQ